MASFSPYPSRFGHALDCLVLNWIPSQRGRLRICKKDAHEEVLCLLIICALLGQYQSLFLFHRLNQVLWLLPIELNSVLLEQSPSAACVMYGSGVTGHELGAEMHRKDVKI